MSDRPVSSFRRHQGAAAEAALSGDDSFNDGGFVLAQGLEFASALDFGAAAAADRASGRAVPGMSAPMLRLF